MNEKTGCEIHELSGEGTEQSPYVITNIYELQAINQGLTCSFKLSNNIDASETKEWNDGKGFEPIGGGTDEFTGSFDGNNYSINNLHINRPERHNTGLFGVLDSDALVMNLILENSKISGNFAVGSIVGHNSCGNIIDSEVNDVVISGKKVVGGIAGWNENPSGLLRIKSTKTYIKGITDVGGIIGDNSGYVMEINMSKDVCCISTGNIGKYCAVNQGYCKTD